MFSTGRRFDRGTAIFLSLLAVAFIVATFDVRSDVDGAGDVLRDGAQTLFAPAQKAADFVVTPVVAFVDGVANLAGLRDENDRLRDRVLNLEQELQEQAALERRLLELEAINGLAPPETLAAVTARIYSSGPSAFDHIRYIDKGTDDGVVVGQAVIDENGLVGRVDQVTGGNARVRLITDPLIAVGVRIQQTNETGIISGQGTDRLRLEMFQATEAVRAGDLVVTDGSRFPPGILVGAVRDSAGTEVGFVLRTSVEPAVALSRLDFVKVVVGWSPLDAGLEETDDTVEPPPFIDPGIERQ